MSKNQENLWTDFLVRLSDIKDHFKLADDQLKIGIDQLSQELRSQPVALANITTSGYVWYKKSLLSCFCKVFDPILNSILHKNSVALGILKSNAIPLPLRTLLKDKHQCRNIADKFKGSVQEIESLLPQLSKKNSQGLIKHGENFELVADLLYAISDELPLAIPDWCSACFRRAPNFTKYCDIHRPNKLPIKDTRYRKGLRLSKKVTSETFARWARHRSKRIALGDEVLLVASREDVPNKIMPNMLGIVVDSEIKEFVAATQLDKWAEVTERWDQVLKLCPNVLKIFPHPASNFKNWSDYRSALLGALENDYEETEHPYWIFMSLIEAEEWLTLESTYLDGRLTDTESIIMELLSQGLSNVEIASRVGVSRQRVWQIKKNNS